MITINEESVYDLWSLNRDEAILNIVRKRSNGVRKDRVVIINKDSVLEIEYSRIEDGIEKKQDKMIEY